MYANYKIKYVNYCERNLLFVKLYIFELIKTKLYYILNGWILQKAKKKKDTRGLLITLQKLFGTLS